MAHRELTYNTGYIDGQCGVARKNTHPRSSYTRGYEDGLKVAKADETVAEAISDAIGTTDYLEAKLKEYEREGYDPGTLRAVLKTESFLADCRRGLNRER